MVCWVLYTYTLEIKYYITKKLALTGWNSLQQSRPFVKPIAVILYLVSKLYIGEVSTLVLFRPACCMS